MCSTQSCRSTSTTKTRRTSSTHASLAYLSSSLTKCNTKWWINSSKNLYREAMRNQCSCTRITRMTLWWLINRSNMSLRTSRNKTLNNGQIGTGATANLNLSRLSRRTTRHRFQLPQRIPTRTSLILCRGTLYPSLRIRKIPVRKMMKMKLPPMISNTWKEWRTARQAKILKTKVKFLVLTTFKQNFKNMKSRNIILMVSSSCVFKLV